MTTAPAPADIDSGRIARIVSEVLRERLSSPPGPAAPPPIKSATAKVSPLVVNISVRHMHITQEHLEVLFGAGAELTPMKMLYQEGQFSSQQTVDLVGPKRRMLNSVRILGPTRSASQIELAFSDAIMLGIDVPIRMSADHEGTPGCIVMGPKGHIILDRGVIRAQRHVHMSPADAEHYQVSQGDQMGLIIDHPRCPATLGGVAVRIDPLFKLEVHIDSDEGNACDLPGATELKLVRQNG